MKKFTTMALAMLLMAVPMLLTSCDDDPYYADGWYDHWNWGNNYNNRPSNEEVDNEDFFVAMAKTLSGKWRGDMMAYQLDDRGNAIDSMYYSTDIEFKQYNSRSVSGSGTQYDYNPNTGSLELRRDFTWYIDTTNGNVFLNYKELNGNGTTSNYIMRVSYEDLNLDNRTFTGYLWANDGYEVEDFLFNRFTETRGVAKKTVKRLKLVMK